MKLSEDLRSQALHSDFVKNLIFGNEITLDNTTYEAFNTCQIKGFIERVIRLKKSTAQSPLVFGECFHYALELFYKGMPTDQAIEAACKKADELHLDDLLDEKRSTFSLRELLRFYFFDEQEAPLQVLNLDGTPCVELSFKYKLGEIDLNISGLTKTVTVYWSGKIDLLTKDDEQVWGLDHKTTSRLGDQFAVDKERSSQMLGYSWATLMTLEALGLGKLFKGMKINAVCQLKGGHKRKVYLLPYGKSQLEEWQEETLYTIKLLLEDLFYALDKATLLPRRISCVTKYGSCPHYDVCKMPQRAREATLSDTTCYIKDTWSPLNESSENES